MISVNQLSMQLGHRVLYTDVNLLLQKGHRYGLVGANGVGKTTLLQILSGLETPSEGEVVLTKSAKLGLLQQDHYHFSVMTILNTTDLITISQPRRWVITAMKHIDSKS